MPRMRHAKRPIRASRGSPESPACGGGLAPARCGGSRLTMRARVPMGGARTQPHKYKDNRGRCSTRSQFCGELRIVQNTEGSPNLGKGTRRGGGGVWQAFSRELACKSPAATRARAPDDRLTPNRPRRQLGIAPATVSGEAAPHARSRRGAGERWPSRRDPSPPGWAPRCWRAALPPRCSRVTPAVPVQAAAPPTARLTLGAKIRHTSRNRGGSTLGAPPWPWLREARAEERPRVRRHPPAIPTSDSGRDKSENTRAQSRLLGQGLARDVCAEAMGMG